MGTSLFRMVLREVTTTQFTSTQSCTLGNDLVQRQQAPVSHPTAFTEKGDEIKIASAQLFWIKLLLYHTF